MRLYEALKEHADKSIYPCHMPGHKGNTETGFLKEELRYDITEIDGMDNLHEAKGVILESEKYAASLYGSQNTYYLVGGSTSGILSAISGVTKSRDEILIGRNCHRSVFNAVRINQLKCRYVYPEYFEEYDICGGISPGDVKAALEKHPDIKAVVITSPTYEGICSDVRSIADITHSFGKILIVDAAHGAHFGFYAGFPESAVKQGADIVIHSVHKTLPSPTQTALLHINGDRVNRETVEGMLKIFQSSSPSYLLMAGIDNCMSIIGERGNGLFSDFFGRLCRLEKELSTLKQLRHIDRRLLKEKYGIFDADPGKLIISTKGTGITGRELYDMLKDDHRIQPEMASGSYCLLIMTIMDSDEGFERVKNALICIDEQISNKNEQIAARKSKIDLGQLYSVKPHQAVPVFEAVNSEVREVSINEAEGEISCEYISLYPPGIPFLVPGEEISAGHISGIEEALKQGLSVQGLIGDGRIKIMAHKSD